MCIVKALGILQACTELLIWQFVPPRSKHAQDHSDSLVQDCISLLLTHWIYCSLALSHRCYGNFHKWKKIISLRFEQHHIQIFFQDQFITFEIESYSFLMFFSRYIITRLIIAAYKIWAHLPIFLTNIWSWQLFGSDLPHRICGLFQCKDTILPV